MPIHTLTLTNGDTVKLNTDVSLKKMKKWRKEGLISKNLIGKMMLLESDPKSFETDDLEAAFYLAFINGNPTSNLSQDEFEDLIKYDLETAGMLLSEMLSGGNKLNQTKMQQDFINKTRKNQSGKKQGKAKSFQNRQQKT